MIFTRSRALADRLAELVPGGSHTYAKGADQFPSLAPGVLVRGHGCRVWDADDNEFIEYGMGLRAVGLGHAFQPVTEAVGAVLGQGTNFTRPAVAELEAAEAFLDMIDGPEMVKFTKDGSTATSAALKVARKATGRDMVALCAEHAFFSYDDWFISTTTMNGGTLEPEARLAASFSYNDLDSVHAMFAAHPNRIAAVFLEPTRTEPPAPGFLEGLRAACTSEGAVLVFDEMITGFRYTNHGYPAHSGVTPDLSTFGKALANGFSVSALCGRREFMELGSRNRHDDNVFLLSTTHGAELPSLAAAVATMAFYATNPVIEHLATQGTKLATGMTDIATRHGISDHVKAVGSPCNLVFSTTDPDGKPSQAFRSLLLQETIRRGVLMPSLVVSWSHDDGAIDATLDALDGALGVYAKALEVGAEAFLEGTPSTPVMSRRWANASS